MIEHIIVLESAKLFKGTVPYASQGSMLARKRAHILKKTMDEQLSTILKEEAKEIEADKKGEGSN